MKVHGRRIAILALLLLPLPAAAARDEFVAARGAFIAAYADAEAGRPAPEGGDSALLSDYPLYPYVQAARLRAAIGRIPAGATDTATDGAVREFLARHGADPVARAVRRPWLASLAERRRWEPFLEIYPQARSPDQALRCRALQGRIALGRGEGLADAAIAEWLTPASADAACDPVFAWLRAQGRLDAALVERRARLALAAGDHALARWLAKSLPDAAARPINGWATLIESPQAALDALIRSPDTPVEDAALLDGWTRLARRNPDAAAERFDALLAARRLDRPAASRAARALALGMAWSRRPQASAYFAKVAAADFDDVAHEWQVRAALWAGDWKLAQAALAVMPAALAGDPRWRYWTARAEEALGNGGRAGEIYASVVPADNWFAVLAAARLGQAFSPHPRVLAADPQALQTVAAMPAMQRARELLYAEMPALAQAEWNAGYDALDEVAQGAAVLLASRWGWHFQAIAAAAKQRFFEDYALLYPRPYDDEVRNAARATGLPPTLIYAVIRQESLYQPWAASAAGAIGLMQLLPDTARRTAADLGRPRPTRSGLMRPEVNVPLGAGYLAGLVDRFGGQLVLALAGYNAGPNAARRWLPERPLDVDVWVENIPYNETRGYVQRVMWHSVVFEWLSDGEAEDASSWLTKVTPFE